MQVVLSTDIILRSFDAIDFRTFKSHLISAEEVVNNMFFVGTANPEELKDNLPLVQLYDLSLILKVFYCNPTADPESNSTSLMDIQRVATKYQW
jgi:hypothetical protein